MTRKGWFTRQPVGVRTALITACGAVVVGLFSAGALLLKDGLPRTRESVVERSGPADRQSERRNRTGDALRIEPYKASPPRGSDKSLSLVAFTLDNRHTRLTLQEARGSEYEFRVVGYAWPVFICAFHNGAPRPAVFTGVELLWEDRPGAYPMAGTLVEPFAAFNVYVKHGLQQFVPPAMLQPGEVGAIRLRLTEANKIEGTLEDDLYRGGQGRVRRLPYDVYHFRVHVGGEVIATPKFLWTPE